MIEITATETHKRGVKGYRVDNIKMMGKGELPIEYLNGELVYWGDYYESKGCYHGDNKMTKGSLLLERGFYEVAEFNAAVKTIKECGTRLKEINARIKAEKQTWNRTVTIKI